MVDYAGAAVGTAFSELFALVKHLVTTVAAFRGELEKIQTTLGNIEPIIKDIDKYNNQLGRGPEQMAPIKSKLEEGRGLVNKCSQIHRLNLCAKCRYSKKLTEFNAEVVKEFQLYMPLLNARDEKEVLVDVKEIGGDVKGIAGDVKEIGGDVKGIAGDVKEVKELLISVQANGGALQSEPEALVDLAAPAAPDFIVGSEVEATLSKVKEQLLAEGASVIVVTAPGGSGKTTLLKKLCHEPAIEGKFNNNIMFVRVSKKPNLTDIVQTMIRHKGFRVPVIETEDDALYYLQQLLNKIGQSPVLLVLDDVWTKSQSILDKFVYEKIKDYKIVVTSRYEFPNVSFVHHLKPLNNGEAMELFRQTVTVDDRSMVVPEGDLLEQVVNHCKRLPLALIVVAKFLRGKDPSFWETKLLDWSEGCSLLDSDSDILDCLRKSLDDLDGYPLIKEHFMDLGSFPEDCKIPVTALIDMWGELYKPDPKGQRAFSALHDLVYRNLADLVVGTVTRRSLREDDDKSYLNHYAMQHDLLRELAIMECNRGEVENRERFILDLAGNNFPDWWYEQKQWTLSARLVSISTDETFSTPWPNLQLPEAEALVLNFKVNSRTRTYALPEFIEKADKLKALIATNYRFGTVGLRNFHVIGSNLRRIRFEGVRVPLREMGKLRLCNLQKISFFRCHIRGASTSDDAKISDAMPNLVEFHTCTWTIPVKLLDEICEIKSLKKLSIISCFNVLELPEKIGQLALLEVVMLNSCARLSKLPDSIGSLQKLTSLNISNCRNLRNLPDQIGQLVNLEKINMKGCPRLSELPRSIVKLRKLKKVVCDKEKKVMWKPFKSSLSGLNIIACVWRKGRLN